MSEAYERDNLLDRLSDPATLQVHYDHIERRERALVDRRLRRTAGDVLSVGCGWHPGRHLFPAPAWRLTGTDLDADKVTAVVQSGVADRALVGRAGELPLPEASFDVVLYRLVLHHVAFQGPLEPCFAEARRLLRPGGALVAVEPGLLHPVGAGLAAANAIGLGTAVHGTPDDLPLSPRALIRLGRDAGLRPEIHAVTYTWRRLPASAQRSLQRLDRHGSRPRLAPLGHTLMLIAWA
ncbi:MAG: class I SAM-dependent methyltransferase [Thermoleophilaceae bacterium]